MKKHMSTIILIVILLAGLSLLLYPTVSDYWNKFHQSQAISDYAEAVADLDDETYERLWNEARAYNDILWTMVNLYSLKEVYYQEYDSLINVSGNGIMGYIEIESINCYLPIYHGVEETVLQIAVGHIEGTSLPVGGPGSHCVLSGHRGLPSARLFTDLDQLREGDTFVIRVLDETLTYEVDQIHIVLPEEVQDLELVEERDYCTLVTCTPYGINSHRMLVRGHRIDNLADASSIRVTADAMQLKPVLITPVLMVPILLLLLIWVKIRRGRR